MKVFKIRVATPRGGVDHHVAGRSFKDALDKFLKHQSTISDNGFTVKETDVCTIDVVLSNVLV